MKKKPTIQSISQYLKKERRKGSQVVVVDYSKKKAKKRDCLKDDDLSL